MEKFDLDSVLKTINENTNMNSLIQSSPICHKIFDTDFKMQFMSQSGVTALRIDNIEDFYGKTFPPHTAPKVTRDIFHEHMVLATKGETKTAEYHFFVDGKIIWFRTTFSPIFCPDGELMYIRVDSMDVTDKKLGEENILAAKEEAERANASKSEFLSRMSHELRTPMNAILGFGQLMELDTKEALTPSQKKRVGEILKSGKHLLELIDEVLDLSRIESNQLTLYIENVYIQEVIEETLNLILPIAKQKNISIEKNIQGNGLVFADRTKVKQVLLNLLSNAVKYNCDNGSVILDSQITALGEVSISVKDTGPGLSAKQLERIFEPFNRLGAENTEIVGTGIGLTITKRLMEHMEGSIQVESKEGQGSTFTLHLPEGKEMERQTILDDLGAAQQELESYGGSYKVLYIEDNPANLSLVQQFLEMREEICLLTAPQAQIGIDLAQAHLPDLILMDINLPEMDGFEAFRRLSESEVTKDIPVIAVSANAMETDVKKALKAGFKSYIKKPFDLKYFMQEINNYLLRGEVVTP